MARWKIKNVGMKGVAMAVPKNVVKTSDFDFFSQEEAEVFDNAVGQIVCVHLICARLLRKS